MRWGWISFRAFRWPVMVMLGGWIVATLLAAFGAALGEHGRGEFERLGFYAFAAAWGVALTWILAAYWRLVRWEKGLSPACDLCSGPLGWELPGKTIRGQELPDYHLCWNCGRNRRAG